ncbi:hypothetical protein JB92DRAFT_3084651 [Gautieria morchelliformis]|nr:hypothetical protein JB92DRAFT_3084651 [Gautieria morchelliformis]
MTRSASRGPLNRLTLASRKRPSATPSPPPPTTPTLVQDGSYLEALGLKLSNAVSKALAQPTGPPTPSEVAWNGRRALPKGRGDTLGALIGAELEASALNPHLHRAILRSLHRPLSVLLSNLSAQLLPATSSPQFVAHPTPATPSSAQLYAAAFATFAAELLESLDARGLFLTDHHGVLGGGTDSLRGIREGLESLVGRVINPLVSGIRQELVPLIDALECNAPVFASPLSPSKQGGPNLKGAAVHTSIVSLHNAIHVHARNLAQYTTPPTMTSQTTLATLLISLVWHGLVALSHRAPTPCSSCAATITTQQTAISTTLRWMKTTPPSTPPSVRFSIKLPPSRPPSPPTPQTSSPVMDARALYNVFNVLPRPNEDARYALAREAVDEAFGGLAALCALLDYEAAGDLENLEGVTADLPTVIALPVLFRIFGRGQESGASWDVPSLLGVTEQQYRDACLGGFGRAEECGPTVARRVLDVVKERHDARCERLIHWLEGRANLGD